MIFIFQITETLSEEELRAKKDELYSNSLKDVFPNSLLELICEKENIIDAIRKIKSNGGFKTAGVDEETGQEFLNNPPHIIFERIRKALANYEPQMVRRVEIPKANGKKRPLGIPAIVDRIIQTAVTNVIEPILEAQMYEHSYGFRPLRGIEHAYGYISALTTHNQKHFIVEGDIKGYFDNINHNILIDKLWKYGIRDKRVIMLIKKILKAGIHGVKDVNDIGTPQGGTISTILSNVYLTEFDHWVDRQWRKLETKHDYKNQSHKTRALKTTNLKSGVLIRYADDWIIMTDSQINAERWKYACQKYLKDELKIELSEEKTLITDLRENKATFLGYDMFKAKGRNGNYTLRTAPNPERLELKRKRLNDILKNMRRSKDQEELYKNMVLYNSTVRGLRNFYNNSTLVANAMGAMYQQLSRQIYLTADKCNFKQTTLKNIANLRHLSSDYGDRKVYYFEYEGVKYGLEPIAASKFVIPKVKAQWITPYTVEGREKWEEINKKSFTTNFRNSELTSLNLLSLVAKGSNTIYTIEYFINRPMAFNRDKCKCRHCGRSLTGFGDVNIHHLDPKLEPEKVNKLPNLVTLCVECHIDEHRLLREEKNEVKNTKGKTRKTSVSSPKTVQQPSRKPVKEQLINDITQMSMVEVGKKYGVSDNAVRKWCKTYGVLERAKNIRKK